MQGRIIRAVSGFYYVYCEGTVYECKARGSFRKQEISPVVGDGAVFTLTDSAHGVVEEITARKNILARPVIANIDKLFIVSSYSVPAPDLLMIDRLTALAVFHEIEPVIVFNKCDMGDFTEFARIYRNAGFKTYVVSALSGEGLAELEQELHSCICAFAGNSGVGKSSLLNALFGELNLATGDVSNKLGRGRHTTRHTELYPHARGGYVADTPGFSSIEAEQGNYAFKEQLADCFPDFSPHKENCKFTSCTHTREKGCGVLRAVEEGTVENSRHLSYLALFEELKDLKPWNLTKK